jgi:diacylglycerol kinase (ATP)
VIYNPRSGRGRGERVAAAARTALAARGVQVVCRATAAPSHATALAREAIEAGATRIAVAGGDGTVRDVLAGIGPAELPLAVLPAGTGNDLARTLSLPRGVEAAVDLAVGGAPTPVDVWLWNGVPFMNVAGVGLDAAVAATVNERIHGARGTLAYLLGVALTLPGFRPIAVQLRAPEWAYEGRAMLVAVANAQYYGGGMRIAPEARLDDGMLSVVVVEAVPKPELVRQMPRVFAGTHLKHPKVRSFAASRLEIRAETTLKATLDGETIGELPAVVERAPWRAQVLAPRPR